MKLKEKLAVQYFNRNVTTGYSKLDAALMEISAWAFESGFEKARAMAVAEAYAAAIDMDYEDDLPTRELISKELDTQYNLACYEIALRIKGLGEEEVGNEN